MKLTKIALIVAAASFVGGPALADEPSYLGMKRGRYVPAPAPVPETFSWYLRADVGVGWSSGGASESGFEHGLGNGAGFARDATIFSNPSWYDAGNEPFFQGGIGFGRYFSPRFRMDVTVDFKTADSNTANVTDVYAEYNFPGGAATGGNIAWTLRDRVDVTDGVGLINAYLDLVPRGRLTPYVGIGAGFAVRYIDRTHTTTEQPVDLGPPVAANGVARSWSESFNETKIAPAVSGTIGLAWAITPGTIFDINYRYTYIGSVDSTMSIVVPGLLNAQRSKITIEDTHQHALRAGLRWNIW